MNGAIHELLQYPGFREAVRWQTRRLPANETVFSAGDQGRDVFLVLQGRVRVVGNVDLDERRKVRPGFIELGEGQLFGELALFDGETRSATVITLTDCELGVMDGDSLMGFLDHHPQLGYPLCKELIHSMVARLRQANKRVFSLFAWGLKTRGIAPHL